MVNDKKSKICITSLYSYPLFSTSSQLPFGGSEVRVSLIAKELAKRECFDVHMIVWDHGQPDEEVIDHVTIHSWKGKYCPAQVIPQDPQPASEPGFRQKLVIWLKENQPGWVKKIRLLIYKTLRAIYYFTIKENPFRLLGRINGQAVKKSDVAIYDEIDADIYIIHGNSLPAAELALYCKERKKKLVFLGASDGDFHPDYKAHPEKVGVLGLPGYLMLHTISSADIHIVQNERQQKLLKEVFDRESTVINNPIDLDKSLYASEEKIYDVLWVGKSDWIKRPEVVLNLASQFPDYSFMLVMNFSAQNVYDFCVKKIQTLSNVELSIYVPFHEVEKYFSRARLFINTSVFEGFPNTFLQAAKYGAPIVSYNVDPGSMLSKYGCGFHCDDDFDKLAGSFNKLMTNSQLYDQVSRNCLTYIRQHHDKNIVMDEYERVLKSLI